MTFSIIGLDSATGTIGAATQSHYLAVGASVPWVRPSVGAVASQALTEPGHGPTILNQLSNGNSPENALAMALEADAAADQRQLAVLAVDGRAAAHTGARCIPHAESKIGGGFVVAGNLLTEPGTVAAMGAAFTAVSGKLADRLLAALVAGQGHGGDLRGMQSAALVVATPDKPYPAIDLRVDDHPDPIAELSRLLDLHGSFRQMGNGINALFAGRRDEAVALLSAVSEQNPENKEMAFWAQVAAGHSPVGLGSHWAELAQRLMAIGKLPSR